MFNLKKKIFPLAPNFIKEQIMHIEINIEIYRTPIIASTDGTFSPITDDGFTCQ